MRKNQKSKKIPSLKKFNKNQKEIKNRYTKLKNEKNHVFEKNEGRGLGGGRTSPLPLRGLYFSAVRDLSKVIQK